jgi:hypothetical protein
LNFAARGPDVGLLPQTQRMSATYLVERIKARVNILRTADSLDPGLIASIADA